jgi:hypothetical protein
VHRGWLTWVDNVNDMREAEIELERKRTKMTLVLRRVGSKVLGLGFYSWRAAVETERGAEALRKQMIMASSNTIKLYFNRVFHAALTAALTKWKALCAAKKKEARSLHSYFQRAVNRQLSEGFETWRVVVWDTKEAERREADKVATMKRVLSHLARTLLSQHFLCWLREANYARDEEERRRLAAQTIFTSLQRFVNGSIFRGFNTWKRAVESKITAEHVSSTLTLYSDTRFLCGLKILQKTTRAMGKQQVRAEAGGISAPRPTNPHPHPPPQLQAAFIVWRVKCRAETDRSRAFAVVSRMGMSRNKKLLIRAVITWRGNAQLCTSMLSGGALRLKAKRGSANAMRRMLSSKIARNIEAAFALWKFDTSAAKSIYDMKTNAATLVLKSIQRSLKLKCGRAFFSWSHEVKKHTRLKHVFTRSFCNRAYARALQSWKLHTRHSQKADENKSRCCYQLRKVVARSLNQQLSASFYHLVVATKSGHVSRNQREQATFSLVGVYKRWQLKDLSRSLSTWKQHTAQARQQSRMDQLVALTELNSTDITGIMKSNALRTIAMVMRGMLRGMVTQFWLKWKAAIWGLRVLESHEDMLFLEKKRKVRRAKWGKGGLGGCVFLV